MIGNPAALFRPTPWLLELIKKEKKVCLLPGLRVENSAKSVAPDALASAGNVGFFPAAVRGSLLISTTVVAEDDY